MLNPQPFMLKIVCLAVFFGSVDASANSLRSGKLIGKFLDHRVKEVIEAVKLDIHLENSHLFNRQDKINKIVHDPHYIPNASSELDDYVNSMEITKSMLWRLRDSKGMEHTLFGTVHSMSVHKFDLAARLKLIQTIHKRDLFLGEKTGNSLLRQAKQHDFLDERLILNAMDTLDDQVSFIALDAGKEVRELETAEEIALAIRQSGLQAEDLDDPSLDPLLDKIEKLGHSETGSIAEKADIIKEIIAQKTAEEQVKLAYLKLGYARGNAQEITSHLLAADLEKVDDVLLGYRNELWAKRIADACGKGEQSCFAYVGVAHMLIDSGNIRSLITLLRERGYQAEELF